MTFAHERIKPFIELNETKAVIDLIQNPTKGKSINEITVIDFSVDGSQVFLKTPEDVFEVDFSGEEKPEDMILQDVYEHLYTIDAEDLEFDENGLISFAELDEYYYVDQGWEDDGEDEQSAIVWEETAIKTRETRLGGVPDFAEGEEILWPHLNINGEMCPMIYAGQVQLIHGRFVYLFIGALNQAGKLVNAFPFGYIENEDNYENVDMVLVDHNRIPIASPKAVKPVNGYPAAPVWNDGKAVPAVAKSFIFQIPFQPGGIPIGFGGPLSSYYVFWDREDRVQIVHQQG